MYTPPAICKPPLTTFFQGWADLLSLLLLALSIATCGTEPRRRVWGNTTLQQILITAFMYLSFIFSLTRFLLEGTCIITTPRQFLFTSIIYSTRWMYLYCKLLRYGTHSKAFVVARALRKLKTIRLGCSIAKARKFEKEVIIRQGARVVKGDIYYRGVVQSATFHKHKKTWMVRLTEQELHSDILDIIGTIDFHNSIENDSIDMLYKMFYDLILLVDAENEQVIIDYSPFLKEFGAVSKDTRQAQRVSALKLGGLGDVARRVAADACYYIFVDDGEFRTPRHVERINECVEKAAKVYFK